MPPLSTLPPYHILVAILQARQNLLKPVARLILVQRLAIPHVIKQRAHGAMFHDQIQLVWLPIHFLEKFDDAGMVQIAQRVSLLRDALLVLRVRKAGLFENLDGNGSKRTPVGCEAHLC